jgi:DNA-binding response OmpR family regulator
MPGHQVLVVDDDQDIRESLMDFLQDHGYQPLGATHGRDALEKLGKSTERPCLIILDLMMPIMDGKTFREQQLRDPELSRIPVVVISAYRDVAVTGLQVTSHIPKPLNLTALLDVVRAHCKLA